MRKPHSGYTTSKVSISLKHAQQQQALSHGLDSSAHAALIDKKHKLPHVHPALTHNPNQQGGIAEDDKILAHIGKSEHWSRSELDFQNLEAFFSLVRPLELLTLLDKVRLLEMVSHWLGYF